MALQLQLKADFFRCHRFNYHLEKVRDIVNNACTHLLPVDEPELDQSMDTDEFNGNTESMQIDAVEKEDRLMCEIVDEIPFK